MLNRPLAAPLLAALALAGCASQTATPESALDGGGERDRLLAYANAQQTVAADLAALQDLELFEVSAMIQTNPNTPNNCYGPCEGEEAAIDAFLDQADRLHALAQHAATPNDDYVCYQTGMDVVEGSLDELQALEIVDIGEMLLDEPTASPNCYNLPCAADVQAADEANEARAQQIWRLAQQSKGL